MSSFTQKKIEIHLTLGSGIFGEGTGNTKIIKDLRCEVEIEKCGQPSKNQAKIKIYGMNAHDMNALATLAFKPLVVRKNTMRIFAGDARGMSQIYFGDIAEAWGEYNAAPDVFFHAASLTGWYSAIKPTGVKSIRGGVDVAQILEGLAREMGCSFTNIGVSEQLANPYLTGTAYSQAQAVAKAARISMLVDDDEMIIAPVGTPRRGDVPLLSRDTGMVGYPIFSKDGIEVSAIFDPAIKQGGLVKVVSDIPTANGVWMVTSLRHSLASEKPDGDWFTNVKATYVQ